MFWGLLLFYTHLLLLLQTSVLWLSIVTFNNDAKPPPKWILRKFSLGGLPHLETFTWQIWPPLRRLPGLADRATYLSWSPHLSCKCDHIKMRDYMDRRVTSPTLGPPPPCKQALSLLVGKSTLLRISLKCSMYLCLYILENFWSFICLSLILLTFFHIVSLYPGKSFCWRGRVFLWHPPWELVP